MTHIIPVNDYKKHDESNTCDCSPYICEDKGEVIVIHNAYDGRELIEQGFQNGLKMNGIKTRDGKELEEGDVIETVQGSILYCVNYFGLRPKLVDSNKCIFDLEDYMSPNIWKIGNLFENPRMRNIFREN